MNTQEKLDTLSTVIIEAFKANKGLEYVYTQAVPIAYANGIKLQEIEPLVKTIGRDNGLYTDKDGRKENFNLDIGNLSVFPKEYTSLIVEVNRLATMYGVPVKWAMVEYTTRMKSTGADVPVKPQLSGWKLSALECWKENSTRPDIMDVRRWLREEDHNHSLYTQAIHELFQQLVELGEDK